MQTALPRLIYREQTTVQEVVHDSLHSEKDLTVTPRL